MKLSIIKICVLAGFALTSSSCLKDDNVEDMKYGFAISNPTPPVVRLPYDSHDNILAVDLADKTVNLDVVTVGYSVNGTASEDIVVELSDADSQAMIDDYNEENETELVPFPKDLYTMPSSGLTITIPKGSRSATLPISFNPSKLDLSHSYALAYKIKSVSKSGVALDANYTSVVVSVTVKNKYDGEYTVTGTFKDQINALWSGKYPKTVQLITSGANSVDFYDTSYGYYCSFLTETGSTSYFGNFCPKFSMDLSSNAVTSATNLYGQGTNSSSRSARLNPAGTNKFTFGADGKVQKLEISYMMDQAGSLRATYTETFVYKQAR